LKLTVIPCRKWLPVTVSANAGPPTTVELGFKLPMVGAAMNVSSCAAEEVSSKFTTSIDACAGALTVGTVAVRVVLFTKVVGSWVPFISTTAPLANPSPVTVSVKAGVPAVRMLGFSPVMNGSTGSRN
jgi:hypothetical protein